MKRERKRQKEEKKKLEESAVLFVVKPLLFGLRGIGGYGPPFGSRPIVICHTWNWKADFLSLSQPP